jgi:hypothetical protein
MEFSQEKLSLSQTDFAASQELGGECRLRRLGHEKMLALFQEVGNNLSRYLCIDDRNANLNCRLQVPGPQEPVAISTSRIATRAIVGLSVTQSRASRSPTSPRPSPVVSMIGETTGPSRSIEVNNYNPPPLVLPAFL